MLVIALVGNKADLYLSQEVTEQEQRKLAEKYKLLNYRISCRDGNGIEEMLMDLVKRHFHIEQTGGITINGQQKTEEKPFCTWFKSKKKKDDTNGRRTTINEDL